MRISMRISSKRQGRKRGKYYSNSYLSKGRKKIKIKGGDDGYLLKRTFLYSRIQMASAGKSSIKANNSLHPSSQFASGGPLNV